jgi:hypothetical protein
VHGYTLDIQYFQEIELQAFEHRSYNTSISWRITYQNQSAIEDHGIARICIGVWALTHGTARQWFFSLADWSLNGLQLIPVGFGMHARAALS